MFRSKFWKRHYRKYYEVILLKLFDLLAFFTKLISFRILFLSKKNNASTYSIITHLKNIATINRDSKFIHQIITYLSENFHSKPNSIKFKL